jgi:hypothetical protein
MTASEIRVSEQPTARGRAYWLPFAGAGNGLGAAAWAPIADLPRDLALGCLGACAEAGVAAFTAPRGGPRPSRKRWPYRVWVDSARFPSAEEAIRNMLIRTRAEGRAVRRNPGGAS